MLHYGRLYLLHAMCLCQLQRLVVNKRFLQHDRHPLLSELMWGGMLRSGLCSQAEELGQEDIHPTHLLMFQNIC
jgi:hypothetical protein